MKIGWIDGIAGASGDMLLGALVDAGVALDRLQTAIDPLGLGVVLRSEPVLRGGLGATKVHVDAPESAAVRHLADIVELLGRVDHGPRERAVATFERLARAEAAVHRVPLEEVHFHEVGAIDSIADIVGVCVGLTELDLDSLRCSTLSLGSGVTRSAHGPIPVPAPAVLAVLDGIGPVAAGPAPYEATTPTGAALLAEWVDSWGAMPTLTIESVGVGAGTRDTEVLANVCRLVIGGGVGRAGVDDVMVQIDANVDDMDPRIWPEAIASVMSAGAVDAWVTPIVMKKGRPAHTLSALCSQAAADPVSAAIFGATTTIGVRRHTVDREVLVRQQSTVEVDGQVIRVKAAMRNGEVVNRSAEWDDVVAAAAELGRSAHDVLTAATAQIHRH